MSNHVARGVLRNSHPVIGENQKENFSVVAYGREIPIGGANAVAYSPDGKYIAVSSKNLCLIEVESGRILKRMRGHKMEVHSVAFSPDDSLGCLKRLKLRRLRGWKHRDQREMKKCQALLFSLSSL